MRLVMTSLPGNQDAIRFTGTLRQTCQELWEFGLERLSRLRWPDKG